MTEHRRWRCVHGKHTDEVCIDCEAQDEDEVTVALPPDPAPMIEGGLLAAAPLGLELAKAVTAQELDGIDRSEFILKTAIQFLCVWGLGE